LTDQAELDRLQRRLDTLYDDRLDGRIDGARYDQKAAEIQEDQQRIRAKVSECRGTLPPAEAAVNLLALTSRSADLFAEQSGAEQRKLLRLVLGDAIWQAGELRMSFQPPFEQLRLSNSTSTRNHAPNMGGGGVSDIWRRGGIRTRCGTIRSATCRFYVAKVAIDAIVAMAPWPILAHGRD
jgi:hypothetical protein